jgi:hypothetical protein
MNVFELRERLVGDYADYTRSFIAVRDERIRELVESELESGLLWPDPIIQLNPAFEPGEWIDESRRAPALLGMSVSCAARQATPMIVC